MPRPRRSNRGTIAKYTDDPFEIAGVTDESDAGNNVSGQKKAVVSIDSSSDEEFKAANDDEEDVDDQDELSDEMIPENEDENEPVSEEDEGVTYRQQPVAMASKMKVPKKRPPTGAAALKDDGPHSRGVWNTFEHLGKTISLQMSFSIDEKSLLSIVYTRDRWATGIDSALPTRSSLDNAREIPSYGYGPTFGLDPDESKREETHGWDWYYSNEVGERFRKRQRLEPLEEKEARRMYLPRPMKRHTVFMGPADNQMKFTLGQHDFVNYGEAWEGSKSSSTKKGQESTSKRQGWLLNLGQKVQCMGWAPNQPGLTQYLAVASPISEEQKGEYLDPFKDRGAPAFRPSAPYACMLQLWSFKALRGKALTKALDTGSPPKLRLGLCTNWGDIRRIAWCPMSRDSRDEDDEDALKNVGLLAGIWSDGYLRVLDIKTNRDPNNTEFHKVLSPVFEAKPPSTLCTCVAWLSPTDIAVGCANGFVAIWSIIPSQEPSINTLPYFYEPIHSTYILTITPAYPTHAHMLATTSMDGETRLISITDPRKDVVDTPRMRMGSPHLSYSPLLQSFVSSDENDFVRLVPARRFFTTTAVAKLPSTISAHAPCSTWHPSALFGCTGGAVIATNPLRRILHSKEKQWQQAWFTHEWVRSRETDNPGTSRFYDGYRAESIGLSRNMTGDQRVVNGVMMITIYEEGTHVSSLSWNPNQTCAGWASAGLGCGLVRVEDLAL
ncbi:hypothetical protein BDV59DRAFT_169415, partial [Aspergillus ambiguus]|uniref:transcription factor TFIIIC subunit TFC6 n=1 Tax=Aspergillus ambiguus TaxID=176160 RepID=UPI003CCD0D09